MNRISDDGHLHDELPEYARGKAADPVAIEAHLEACVECREELELLRALLEAPGERMTVSERDATFETVLDRAGWTGSGSGWRSAAWKVAAAIAMTLTALGVWQTVRSGEASWDPAVAMEAWEADLADLDPAAADVLAALGYEEGSDYSWLDAQTLSDLDPAELLGPWELTP